MAITLVQLLTLGSIELADMIDSGEVLTSTLVKKAITLLKMEISKVKGMGLKKVGNDKQGIEYEMKEQAMYDRLNALKTLYDELIDSETGSTSSADIWFIGSQYDSEMS